MARCAGGVLGCTRGPGRARYTEEDRRLQRDRQLQTEEQRHLDGPQRSGKSWGVIFLSSAMNSEISKAACVLMAVVVHYYYRVYGHVD